jgi:hypothetical protein
MLFGEGEKRRNNFKNLSMLDNKETIRSDLTALQKFHAVIATCPPPACRTAGRDGRRSLFRAKYF